MVLEERSASRSDSRIPAPRFLVGRTTFGKIPSAESLSIVRRLHDKRLAASARRTILGSGDESLQGWGWSPRRTAEIRRVRSVGPMLGSALRIDLIASTVVGSITNGQFGNRHFTAIRVQSDSALLCLETSFAGVSYGASPGPLVTEEHRDRIFHFHVVSPLPIACWR